MARIRTVKPEFWQNEALSAVSAEAALLAVALLNYADDHGYFNANVGLVRAACFPLRRLDHPIEALLAELEAIGYIAVRECTDGRRVGRIITFARHQRVNRPTPSTLAPLWEAAPAGDSMSPHGALSESSVSPHGALSEPSVSPHAMVFAGKEGKGRERKGMERKGGIPVAAKSPRGTPSSGGDNGAVARGLGGIEGVWQRLPEHWRTDAMRAMLEAFERHRREMRLRPWTPTGCEAKVREWLRHDIADVIAGGYRSIERNYNGLIIERGATTRTRQAPGADEVDAAAERILRARRGEG